MTPGVSQRLLDSLNLVLMDEEGETQSSRPSPRSTDSQGSETTTITCSAEGSQCAHRDQQLMAMEESSRLCNRPDQPPSKQITPPPPPCCMLYVRDPQTKRLYPLGFST